MPRPLPRNRDQLLEHLRQQQVGVAAAELSPVIDRLGAIRRCIEALESGEPIEACHLEDLDPLDDLVDGAA